MAVPGCAQTFDAATLGVPASMAEAPADAGRGEPFRINKKAVYLVAGIFPLAKPSLEDVLAGQAASGERIAGLTIRVRSRWSDLLITLLTAGLVVPRSVTFEGRVLEGGAQ